MQKLRAFKLREESRAIAREDKRKADCKEKEKLDRDCYWSKQTSLDKEEKMVKDKSSAIIQHTDKFVSDATKTFVAESGKQNINGIFLLITAALFIMQ